MKYFLSFVLLILSLVVIVHSETIYLRPSHFARQANEEDRKLFLSNRDHKGTINISFANDFRSCG